MSTVAAKFGPSPLVHCLRMTCAEPAPGPPRPACSSGSAMPHSGRGPFRPGYHHLCVTEPVDSGLDRHPKSRTRSTTMRRWQGASARCRRPGPRPGRPGGGVAAKHSRRPRRPMRGLSEYGLVGLPSRSTCQRPSVRRRLPGNSSTHPTASSLRCPPSRARAGRVACCHGGHRPPHGVSERAAWSRGRLRSCSSRSAPPPGRFAAPPCQCGRDSSPPGQVHLPLQLAGEPHGRLPVAARARRQRRGGRRPKGFAPVRPTMGGITLPQSSPFRDDLAEI